MLLDDGTGDVADILVADAGIVGTLRGRVAGGREAQRAAVLIEEIFLLEAEPGVLVVEDGGALVRFMRGNAVGHHHFAHDERTVGAGRVGIDRDRLQDAIGAPAFGLLGRRSVKAPQGKLLKGREGREFLDLGFAAETGYRLVSIEPNVLELKLRHQALS
jgi:hypothetical protein